MDRWLDIATLEHTKSLKGEFVARCASDSCFLVPGMDVCLVPPRIDVPRSVTVSKATPMNDGRIRVSFDGIEDPNIAEMMVGCHCLVRKSLLSGRSNAKPDISTEVGSLVGWDLYDGDMHIGRIAEVEMRPSQPLLVVSSNEADALIPFAEELLVEVDDADRKVYMDLPRGLLDL